MMGMGEEEKKIEIENTEQLARYIGKLFVLQHCGHTPEKKWSYVEGKIVPYTREAPVHVFFYVFSDTIKVTIESKEDVSELEFAKGQFTTDEDEFKKNPNSIYYTYIDSWRITYPHFQFSFN